MFQFALYSARLLLQGKLFRDTGWVIRQGLLATGVVVSAFFLLSAIGLPLVVDVVVTSLAGGAAIPYLFRDLRAG